MKILLTGDINFRLTEPLTEEASREILRPLQPWLDAADFRVVNLETPLADQKKYPPIYKAGPNLISDPANIAFLKALGTDAASLANNHTGDYGYGAIFDTLDLLDRSGIRHCGAGKDIEAAYRPAVLEKDGMTVAILSVCENEFGIADEQIPGSAGYEPRRILRALRQAKTAYTKVIVFFHGGNEHNPLPSPATQERYRLLCDMGADAVIATHPHCPQGWETYEGKPIVYSMGNFLFKSSVPRPADAPWYYGYAVMLDVGETLTLRVLPYKFTQAYDYTALDHCEAMRTYLDRLNAVIADPEQLKHYFSGWAWLHQWCPKLPTEESGVAQCAAGSWDLVHEESHRAKLDEVFRIFTFKEELLAQEWAVKITELQRMPV